MYKFFLNEINDKKGFTLTELVIVVAIMSILVCVGVPIYRFSSEKHKINDCEMNCQLISTAVQEAMCGMLDNGKKQDVINLGESVSHCKKLSDWDSSCSEYASDFGAIYGEKVKSDAYCFQLSANDVTCFTLGDVRGGYRDLEEYPDYNDGCKNGHYLKKSKLNSTQFYKFLANAEVPVCPFDDDGKYFYYVFSDGTVACGCHECLKAKVEAGIN